MNKKYENTACGKCGGCCGAFACHIGGQSCCGCSGGCSHAAGDEFQWDYDDTVLVFSSDMLEEEENK